MQEQWFEVLKFSNKDTASISKKKDICYVEANNHDEAYNYFLNQLASYGYVKCEYFSEGKRYNRSIGQIINFLPISKESALERQIYWKGTV